MGGSVPPKKHIIIIGVLSMISLGLGYWYGMPKKGSGGGGGKKEPEFLKEGLVAYFPFNGNANDESGNGNDGKVYGATLTMDRHGANDRAYDFDGKGDLIKTPSSQSISTMRSLSVTFWVKADKIQKPGDGYTGLITIWNGHGGDNWGVWIFGDSICAIAIPQRQAAERKLPIFPKELWHQIIYAHNESGASVYVDGKMVDRTDRLQISLPQNDAPVIIGADSTNLARFFSGQIDDVRIYNRALSEAEVKELYEFEKPKTQQTSTATPTRQLTPEEKKVVGVYKWKNRAGGTYKRVFLDNKVLEFYTDDKKRTDVPDGKWEIVDGELHIEGWPKFQGARAVARINNDGSFTFVAEIKDGGRIQKQTITAEDTYKKIK